LEILLHFPKSVFLFAALLVALVTRIAPCHSRRNYGALSIAAIIALLQLHAGIVGSRTVLLISLAMAAVFGLYFVCLLVYFVRQRIWRHESITPWTVRQRAVASVFALSVMLPMWFFGGKFSPMPYRADIHEYQAIPVEILGLQTSVSGNTNGMIRMAKSVHLGGKEYEVGFLEDEVPRKVDGPIFVSLVIKCTEKTRQTVDITADTGIMLQSDERAVMDIVHSIVGEVDRVFGFKMQHRYNASIRRRSDNVALFSGWGGNLAAEIIWVRQGKGKGFLRLVLHDSQIMPDTGSYSEKSPLYADIMANEKGE